MAEVDEIELQFDEAADNWVFRVPGMQIIGGASTKEQAIERALDAIAFALGDDNSP